MIATRRAPRDAVEAGENARPRGTVISFDTVNERPCLAIDTVTIVFNDASPDSKSLTEKELSEISQL